ncbi:MAG: DUF2384 domain-containing protein [Chloroflexi bacterium]|nr:DUF2384 domain-containing protein [Chloroflexota bacterium]
MAHGSALQLAPWQVLRGLIDDLGMEDRDLRIIFDVEQRSIEKWLSGETFTSYDGARLWLRAPSRYLAGLTPLQVLRAGDTEHATGVERVEETLEALDSGAFL